PSEKGIDVAGAGPTTFITYKMPVPQYTIIPYVIGKIYNPGDVIFDPTIGECLQALALTAALPADPAFWKRVPFLEKWAMYVEWGAYADCLSELDNNENLQVNLALAQLADGKALDGFQREVDA